MSSPRFSSVVLLLLVSSAALACRSEKTDGPTTQQSSSAPSGRSPSASSDLPQAAPIANAEAVIAGLRPAFRACYRAGLRETPNLSGSVVMDGRVAPDGTVTSVTQNVPTTLPKPVVACLEYVLTTAVFTPPGGTGSSVRVPINFKAVDDAGA